MDKAKWRTNGVPRLESVKSHGLQRNELKVTIAREAIVALIYWRKKREYLVVRS
jgi:hypothetical protein